MAIDYTRINWKNEPNETTPLSAENLNKMDKAIDDLVTDVNSLKPNPVEEATEGLEKLAYGGTVYEVKGGHKIVNDSGTTLAQKDNMKFGGVYSHNSSTMTEVDIVREFNSVADIEALTGEEAKGFQYLDDDVYDEFTAGDIAFDNSDTSFTGNDVQEVLEEVDSKLKELVSSSFTASTNVTIGSRNSIFKTNRLAYINLVLTISGNISAGGNLVELASNSGMKFVQSQYVYARKDSDKTIEILTTTETGIITEFGLSSGTVLRVGVVVPMQ